jgi:hypothetical protein
MAEEAWMTEVVEVEEPPVPRKKRRKYRKYARPVCTEDQKKVLWEHQKGL